MGGGLMQLVAYGAQDIYLTGNPQITFFKVVYRRHTNFSMETISQTLNGSQSDVTDGSATCTISRNGDLVYKVYVTADSATATNGLALVNEVELEIGGQRIDRHYHEWNEVWNELSTSESKAIGLKAMQCEVGTGGTDAVETVQIPLNFWFCRNPGLALPLIALQYHEVKLKFTWGSAGIGLNPEVWCDYIYLDTDERRRFAQVSHEYLIEQLQKETYPSGAGDKKLNFNHPVKELIWVNDEAQQPGVKYQLKLNGHDRFAEQPKDYFMLRQPFDYHTAVPRQNLPSAAQLNSNYVDFSTNTVVTNLEAQATTADGTVALGATKFVIGALATAALGFATATVKTESAITTVETQVLAFLTATVTANFVVGRLYEISAFGTSWAGGATLSTDTTGKTLIARVTQIAVGGDTDGAVAGEIENTNTCVTFDRLLVDILSDTIDGADLTITGVRELIPNATLATEARTSKMTNEINVYSFALKPEEHQPSGTCNFSRIDNAQLKVVGSDGGGRIYAVNYNVLRIMSGMGGLAYSN